MHRRPLLALLGSTLAAGCSTIGRSPDPLNPTPAPVPTDSPASPEPPGTDPEGNRFETNHFWSLVELETQPVTVSLTSTRARTEDGGAVTLAFVETATADHPALLRGTFQNANPYENTFELQALPIFGNVPSAWPGGRPRSQEYTYRDELLLAPTGNHDLADTVPELALADDRRWRLAGSVSGPWFPERHRLGPDEAVTLEYALVGRQEGEGFPDARYYFEGYGDRDVVFDVWKTDEPGPTDPSGFSGAQPGALPPAAEMAWYHEADRQMPVYLSPSEEEVALPAKIEFTLVNHSHEPVSGNPYFWRLWKLVDGRWFHVAPWGWPQPLVRVAPGGRARWSLAAFTGHTVPCDGASTVGYLGGGRYAFEVDVGREGVTHAALLDLEGPPAELRPTDGVAVTRDGSRVEVEWPRRAEEVPRATLTLTRAGDADGRLITEQVMQRRNAAIRNTLAFMTDDTEAVVLVTDRNTVSSAARTRGYDDGDFRFHYEGMAYRVRAEFDEDSRPGLSGER